MVLQVIEGTLESRIIHLLLEMYPTTVHDLEREMKVKPSLLARTLKGMATRGIVELEPLSDRTFVRLARYDFSFVGPKRSQRKRGKARGKGPGKPKDYEGPMFA